MSQMLWIITLGISTLWGPLVGNNTGALVESNFTGNHRLLRFIFYNKCKEQNFYMLYYIQISCYKYKTLEKYF